MKHRPFLTPIWLSGLAALAAVSIVGIQVWVWYSADSTLIVVVGTSGSSAAFGEDTARTAPGRPRASDLAELFGAAGSSGTLDAIYVDTALLSRMTAAPVAVKLGLAPVEISATDPKAFARRMEREHGGGRVLAVVGAERVMALLAVLTGGTDIDSIRADQQGSVYVVSVPRIGRPTLLRLRY